MSDKRQRVGLTICTGPLVAPGRVPSAWVTNYNERSQQKAASEANKVCYLVKVKQGKRTKPLTCFAVLFLCGAIRGKQVIRDRVAML